MKNIVVLLGIVVLLITYIKNMDFIKLLFVIVNLKNIM